MGRLTRIKAIIIPKWWFILLSDFTVFLAYTIGGLFCLAAYGLTVRRKNSVPSGGCLLVSNHTLFLDPLHVALAVAPRRCYFAIEEKTMVSLVADIALRLLRGFPVPEENPGAITGPVGELLDRGSCVHLFPEGYMDWKNQQVHDFMNGAFFMAVKFKVPIVPVTLVGRRTFRHRILPFLPPVVTAVVGKTYHPEEYLEQGSHKKAIISLSGDIHREIQSTIDTFH